MIRGSQTGSQHPPAPGYVWRRPATVLAGGWHAGPHPATSNDCISSSYKRGAAGSNPAAPTSFCRSAALFGLVVIVKEAAGSQAADDLVRGRAVRSSVPREAPVLARELIPGGRAWQRSPAPVESPGPDAKPVKTSVASRQAGAGDCVG